MEEMRDKEMGDSSPDIDLQDAVLDFDEISEISTVMQATSSVSHSEWTLTRSDDEEAPEITCTMEAEVEEEGGASVQSSRSAGHGPRPLVQAEHVSVTDGPRVVVTIEI
jgi:hypothetical protein